MYRKTFIFICCTLLLRFSLSAQEYKLNSPDGKNTIRISAAKIMTWSVWREKESLLSPGRISLSVEGKPAFSPQVLKSAYRSVQQQITAVVPVRNKVIPEVYNALSLTLKGGYALEFRAYNDGVAYRFITRLGNQPVKIDHEEVNFNFSGNYRICMPEEKDPEMRSHYEATFQWMNIADIPATRYGYLPLYVSAADSGTKMVITEAGLDDYPNLFLSGTGTSRMKGQFPKVVLASRPTGNVHLDEELVRKADYIARTKGSRTFPWRVVMISADDKGLLENEMVYKLAAPCQLKNTAWIRPGKAAWDWWNDTNIYGVPFKAGLNTATYKYYIDFAAAFGLNYVVLDEGWAKSPENILQTNPDVDLKWLISYAAEKKVGLILWALWKPLDQHMEEVLATYGRWGIKGVKVDFMARADQYMVNFYSRMAACAAKNQLLLDFHGAYKPVGLNRTYPNVLNYEGVKGMEQNKWSTLITPVHNTTLPFTRMAAGPMDYTPGAMVNTNQGEFSINWSAPMSMGTRVHQAAMYVVYDAPLQMLCDNPSNYLREPAYTRYIAGIPTTWDKTIGLEGKAGEYVLVARQHGDQWYIGGLTNWTARQFQVRLSFLENKKYTLSVLKDGINILKRAADYSLDSSTVSRDEILPVEMAAGGGYTAVFTPLKGQ